MHGEELEKMNNDLTCICQAVFCKICKDIAHPSISCLENTAYSNSENNKTITYYHSHNPYIKSHSSYFMECENKESTICMICNKEYNEDDHIACTIFFSGVIPNLLK